MDKLSPKIGYSSMMPSALLRTCFAELGSQASYIDALELMIRGTMPRSAIANIEDTLVPVDRAGISERFSTRNRIFVDSWSELVNIASIAYLYNSLDAPGAPYIASIGIESAYRESSLREKYLGDGAIASRSFGSVTIVQSCLAQNIRGDSAGASLQQEVIKRLQTKYKKPPLEPGRILAVTIVSETEDFDNLNFEEIAMETMVKYKGGKTYESAFCIVPSSGLNEPQVVIIPLETFVPGGSKTAIIIKYSYLIE